MNPSLTPQFGFGAALRPLPTIPIESTRDASTTRPHNWEGDSDHFEPGGFEQASRFRVPPHPGDSQSYLGWIRSWTIVSVAMGLGFALFVLALLLFRRTEPEHAAPTVARPAAMRVDQPAPSMVARPPVYQLEQLPLAPKLEPPAKRASGQATPSSVQIKRRAAARTVQLNAKSQPARASKALTSQ